MRLRALSLALCLGIALVSAFSGTGQTQTQGKQAFKIVDIYADSHGVAIAAYQLEWSITSGNARIVGIEGSPQAAFKQPYYDRHALQGRRVIVAAFSTAASSSLPAGKIRLASIRIEVSAGTACKYQIDRIEAADPAGKHLSITAWPAERGN